MQRSKLLQILDRSVPAPRSPCQPAFPALSSYHPPSLQHHPPPYSSARDVRVGCLQPSVLAPVSGPSPHHPAAQPPSKYYLLSSGSNYSFTACGVAGGTPKCCSTVGVLEDGAGGGFGVGGVEAVEGAKGGGPGGSGVDG
ncbi:hypothetical protein PSPO01_14901 [Paraphaeosphaeria sporulosa]